MAKQTKKTTKKKNTSNQKKVIKRDDSAKKLPDREEHFGDWLNEVLLRTELVDYRYNLKGCGVWRAYGFKLRKNINQIIRDLLDNSGHDEYLFPLLVPEKQFMKEAEHVKGFEEEVYWVTHGGLTELDVKLALRPTSETVMYPMFALWIRSHTDLPLKTYQIVNTFRWEGKNTRPLIRVREITNFKEAHTVHSSAEDAQNQIVEALKIYKSYFNKMGCSYIINTRPKWDTFPGAEYTIAFDAIFPGKHRALQVGTVHNLGQTFGKTFDIRFENINGEMEYGYQTCYGISERSIATVIGLHGDNNGLILPPSVAPIHIVILPILFKDEEINQKILDECERIKNLLMKNGYVSKIDASKLSPGAKFYYWEQRGIPLRIELGPKDLEKKHIVVKRRDIGEKSFVSTVDDTKIIEDIKKIMDTMMEDMSLKVGQATKDCLLQTEDMDEALEWVEEDKGFAEIPFCGNEECAQEVEKRVDGLKFLGTPARYLDFLDYSHPDSDKGEINSVSKKTDELYCIVCSKKVDKYWTISKTY